MRFWVTRAVWANTIIGLATLSAALLVSAGTSFAQSENGQAVDIGPSGQAYLEAVGRRVDTNVAYFDPTREAPELSTDIRPEREPREPVRIGDFDIERWQVNLVFGALLLAILYFVVKNAGSISMISRRVRDADSGYVSGRAKTPVEPGVELPKSLSAILANSDRRAAVIELARAVLARVAEANGMLLQRSWTARDTLRRLPREQSHLGAIRDLVLASERVQFGDYPMSEDEFKAHVSAAGPLFAQGTQT